MTPGLLAAAMRGDARTATKLALRRLRGAGLKVPSTPLVDPPERTRRIAIALAFPVSAAQRKEVSAMFVEPTDPTSVIEPSQEITP